MHGHWALLCFVGHCLACIDLPGPALTFLGLHWPLWGFVGLCLAAFASVWPLLTFLGLHWALWGFIGLCWALLNPLGVETHGCGLKRAVGG